MENAENSAPNFDEMCQLCLTEKVELVKDIDDQELQLLLTTYLPVSTGIAGKRPKFVCRACVGSARLCDVFIQICKEADLTLMEYLLNGIWNNTVQVPSWFKDAHNLESQQGDAVPAKTTPCEIIEPNTMQSTVILSEGSEGGFQFSAANTGTPLQYQLVQNSQPSTQSDSQHKPSPAQDTGLQAASSYPQQFQIPSHLPAQYSSNSLVYQVPSHQPQQQQQELQSASSEQPTVVRNIQSNQPILPTLPPVATTEFYCTICSHYFVSRVQIKQHAREHMMFVLCWCGALISQFTQGVRHLQQHRETTWCVLCAKKLSTLASLYGHLERHIEAGLRHRCDCCRMVFVDEKSSLQHKGREHSAIESERRLRPAQKRQSQQEAAIPVKKTGEDIIDGIGSLKLQSPSPTTKPSGTTFPFGTVTEHATSNAMNVTQFQPTQNSQPTPQPHLQYKPPSVQVAGLKTTSSDPHQLPQTSLPLKRRQQQDLQSPFRSCVSRKTETLKPATQAEFLHYPSSKKTVVVRYSLPAGSIQPGSSPVPIPEFHCTICSHDFYSEIQIVQHAIKEHVGIYLTLCWCGKPFAQFSAIVRHLQQHKETLCCVLCGEDLPNLQFLYEHLDQHEEVGLLHSCVVCRSVFLDGKSKRRHIAEKHFATEARSNEVARKRRLQQEDAIAGKKTRDEPNDDVQSLMLQSPSPVQVTGPPTTCQGMPSHEPQQQLQQPSPFRSISAQQPETLQPAVQVVSLEEPSLEQPDVAEPDIPAASQPIQPSPSPFPAPVVYHCTICSQDFAEKDLLLQHATMDHQDQVVFPCFCGQLIGDMHAIAQHLKQHGITVCMLCEEQFSSPQHLCNHLDQHVRVGVEHLCSFCDLVFLDRDDRLRHTQEQHHENLQQEPVQENNDEELM